MSDLKTDLKCDVCGVKRWFYPKKYKKYVRLYQRSIPPLTAMLFVASGTFLLVHLALALAIVLTKHHTGISRAWAILAEVELVVNCAFMGELGVQWGVLSRQVRDSLWMVAVVNILAAMTTFMAIIAALAWDARVYFVMISTSVVMCINVLVFPVAIYKMAVDYEQRKRFRERLATDPALKQVQQFV